MKRIFLPLIALFTTVCLPAFGDEGEGIQLLYYPEYVSKDGQNFVAKILLTGYSTAPEIAPPQVTVLGNDFVYMKATKCSFSDRDTYGYTYDLYLEIGAAEDFGDLIHSHIQLYFEMNNDKYFVVDFWTMQPGLDLGSISPGSQNILFGQTPGRLTYSSSDISSIQSVDWQQKTGSGSWTDIPGATGYSYSPRSLTQTTEFRILVTSKGNDREFTAPVIVNVSPRFVPGTISGSQTIIPGSIPAAITNSMLASGGSAPIAYQWQSSPDNRVWTDIPGATSTTYQPQALTVSTYFRRKAISGTETGYSNVVPVLMKPSLPEYLSFKPVANVVLEEDRDNRTHGLKTYEKVAVLGGDAAAGRFVERAFYYDYRGRIIQTVEKNHLGGISRYSNRYDFVGNVLINHEEHTEGIASGDDEPRGGSHRKLTEFTYDHRGRLLTEKTTLDDGEPATVTCAYDRLGRLAKVESSSPQIITESYDYNIQGWLTGKSTPYFDMTLHYYDPLKPGSNPGYAGNITEWEWEHKGADIADTAVNSYAFTYDELSRLTDTRQYVNGVAYDRNIEKAINYDLNGNIKSLQRYAAEILSDDFIYDYSGNQLASIAGTTAGAYAYDTNGNMTHDGPNNLELTYNWLNLAEKITENGVAVANYSYLSDGTKLSATDAAGNGLCYAGSLVYNRQGGNLSLESAGFSGGRFIAAAGSSGMTTTPNYFIADHLGSVRVIVDANGTVQERNDYYPFGMRWNEGQLNPNNRYRYNGKENQTFLNTPYIDYGARQYDPKYRLGWNSIDPLANEYYRVSLYEFCLNNPIRYFDPNGCSTHTDSLGRVVAVYNDGDLRVFRQNINSEKYDGSKLLAKNGTYVGETEFWDEFLPDFSANEEGFTIQFGESFDDVVNQMHEVAKDMNLMEIAANSAGGGVFDIKKDYKNIGRLLNGVYVSSRSAGNYLAGYNASTSTIMGISISFETFQKLAGALHIEEGVGRRLSNAQKVDIVLFGTYASSDHSQFIAPTWGEIPYQYRMSKKGWNYGK